MDNRACKKKRKTGAILLIVAFSLLQLSLWGPSFIHAFPENETHATCHGDHALCGCAPSRIAAGTCCCALASISPCCQKNYIEAAIEEKATLGTVITSLPCGGSEDPLVNAGIEAYLHQNCKSYDSPDLTTAYKPAPTANQIEHHILPPVPPPKV